EGRRIDLDSRLARAHVESFAQRPGEQLDLARVEETRRPSADVQRADPRPTEHPPLAGDLLAKGLQVRHAKRRPRRRGREVAVRAPRGAERDVDIETDPASHLRIAPSGSGKPASTESSAVRPRSPSHS